ncbi:MAG TPA: hypothetical protein PKM60_10780 [Zoogloea sp.]|nr:hypothetical protein [Zoogloea sp.]
MRLLPILRRIALTALTGLAAAGAFAAPQDKYYEGLLLPDDYTGSIPVTVELHDLSGVLVGKIKAGPPYSGVAPIRAGDMKGDKCDFQVSFSSGIVLRFTGNCQQTAFDGKYAQPGRSDASSRGTFRLAYKEPQREDEKAAETNSSSSGPRTSAASCLNANTRCLIGCPQGDYNAEFLCANRCRSRYKTCKASATLP